MLFCLKKIRCSCEKIVESTKSDRSNNIGERDAFTLLEIILAIAILGIVIAIIGQGFRFGLERVQTSRNELRATMIAESILSQIAANVLPPDAVSETAYEDDKNWIYSVSKDPVTGQDDLLAIKVSVRSATDAKGTLGSVALTRWITNPELTLAEEESQSMSGTSESSTMGSSSTSSTSSSSTTSSKTSSTSGTTGR